MAKNSDIYWRADADRLREFFYWMYERQEIYRKRFIESQEPPWTDDEALKNYHYCHVYRELDRGTRFLLDNVIGRTDHRDVFFNVVWFRLLNLPESYQQAGGFTRVGDFYAKSVVDKLKWYQQNNPVFSPAYRVSAHKFAGSESKIENVVYGIVGDLRDNINQYFRRIIQSDTAAEAFKELKEIPGVGDFLGYELLTDLNYGFLPFTENDLLNIGPGAERGLELIWGDVDEEYVYWLKENQDELLEEFRFDLFKWNGSREKDLTLRDIEHSLCEYSKYRRAKTQSNPNLRRFKALPGEQSDMDTFR